jgi:lycopene beta-cyclase
MEFPIEYKYDFILAGGGMAALSLAYYLNNSTLRNKSILIIDQEVKNKNDHTFCFWEKGNSPFEAIVCQKWNKVWFYGTNNFSKLLSLDSYKYKMIKGIDFYQFINTSLSENPNITILTAKVLEIIGNKNPIVTTTAGNFVASSFVFDSIFRPEYDNPKYNNLLQHFKGWVIETQNPLFKLDEPTLFDFRIDQKNELRFVYVLPMSEKKALIEFTIFSDNLLSDDSYNYYLKNYIENTLKVSDYQINEEEYAISETEFGIVPMSDEPHNFRPHHKILRIGTAGGFVKSSTGYSFQRCQVYLQKLVKILESGEDNFEEINKNKWKAYLDSTLLNVMKWKKAPQDAVFTALFQKNKTETVLKFLSEETTFFQDIKLMNTVPKWPFIKAAFAEILKKLT